MAVKLKKQLLMPNNKRNAVKNGIIPILNRYNITVERKKL